MIAVLTGIITGGAVTWVMYDQFFTSVQNDVQTKGRSISYMMASEEDVRLDMISMLEYT